MTEAECQVAAFVRYKTDQHLDYIPQTVTLDSLAYSKFVHKKLSNPLIIKTNDGYSRLMVASKLSNTQLWFEFEYRSISRTFNNL